MMDYSISISLLEIFTNSVDPDEMPLNVATHQAPTCLLVKLKLLPKKNSIF